MIYVIVITWERGICLIYMPKPEGAGIYIRKIPSAHVITNAKQKHLGCITIVASDWPRTFLHPRCFCLAYYFFLLEILRKCYEEVVGEVAKN